MMGIAKSIPKEGSGALWTASTTLFLILGRRDMKRAKKFEEAR